MDDQKPIGAGGSLAETGGRLPPWLVLLSASLIAFGVIEPRRPGLAPAKASHAADGDRQRETRPPSPVSRPAWRRVLLRVWHGISNDRIMLVAAGVTFYAILALFPGIATIVSIYGLFADPSRIVAHLHTLAGFVPGGGVDVLEEQLVRLAHQDKASLGFGFAASLVFSLWSARAGVAALFDALTAVYEERERRGIFKYYAVTLSFTAGSVAMVLVSLAMLVAVPLVLDRLPDPGVTAVLLDVLRWPILLVLIALALAVIYRYGPCHSRPRLRWITRGSAFAAIAWLATSALFSWYVANFGRYNRTYGSLGAVIGFMTWMWVSIIVVLVGAKLDAEIERQTDHDEPAAPAGLHRAKPFRATQA